MPLGTEVDLGPGHSVLDRDSPTPTEWSTLLWHGRPSQQLLSAELLFFVMSVRAAVSLISFDRGRQQCTQPPFGLR